MSKRALIVIDVQNEYVSGNLPIEFPPVADSLSNIGAAMDAARAAGIPIVVVQQMAPSTSPLFAEGSIGGELHSVVSSRPFELLIQKKLPSAFTGTTLAAWLQQHAIDTLTIVGYMTHNCDFSTVVHAVHDGLSVEVLSDATGSVPYANQAGSATAEEIHHSFSVVMQSRFAAVVSTAQWLTLLSDGGQAPRDNIHASNLRARGLA